MKKNYYAVWVTEYPEEGSEVYFEASPLLAKKRYCQHNDYGNSPSELSAKRLTKEQYAIRLLLEAMNEVKEILGMKA